MENTGFTKRMNTRNQKPVPSYWFLKQNSHQTIKPVDVSLEEMIGTNLDTRVCSTTENPVQKKPHHSLHRLGSSMSLLPSDLLG